MRKGHPLKWHECEIKNILTPSSGWSLEIASHVPRLYSTEVNQTRTLGLPINLSDINVKDVSGLQGFMIDRVEIYMNISSTALDAAPTFDLYEVNYDGMPTSAPSATAIDGNTSGNTATAGYKKIVEDIVNKEKVYKTTCKLHGELVINLPTLVSNTTIWRYGIWYTPVGTDGVE
jgi:hypothetical protein